MTLRLTFPLLAVLLACAPGAAQARDADPAAHADSAAAAVVRGFHAALEQGDSARVLGYLHPDVVVFEGGHAETLAQYRSHHLGADIAFLREVRQETLRSDLIVSPGTAVSLREFTSRGRFRGREIDAHGTETLLLVPTPEGWKIRHIHWSSR